MCAHRLVHTNAAHYIAVRAGAQVQHIGCSAHVCSARDRGTHERSAHKRNTHNAVRTSEVAQPQVWYTTMQRTRAQCTLLQHRTYLCSVVHTTQSSAHKRSIHNCRQSAQAHTSAVHINAAQHTLVQRSTSNTAHTHKLSTSSAEHTSVVHKHSTHKRSAHEYTAHKRGTGTIAAGKHAVHATFLNKSSAVHTTQRSVHKRRIHKCSPHKQRT